MLCPVETGRKRLGLRDQLGLHTASGWRMVSTWQAVILFLYEQVSWQDWLHMLALDMHT